LDFQGDLYGQTMALDLIEYQRPEIKYHSIEALIAQMQADIQIARGLLT